MDVIKPNYKIINLNIGNPIFNRSQLLFAISPQDFDLNVHSGGASPPLRLN